MLHIRSVATGVAGSPFYTNLYFDATMANRNIALARTRTFWSDLASVMRTGLVTNVQSDVREIDPVTGTVLDIQAGTEQAPVTGTAAGSATPPATQGLIQLLTPSVRRNRRVRGRIFVPGVMNSAVTGTGTAIAAYQTSLQAAATTLATIAPTCALVVWSRPIEITGPVVAPGQMSTVTSASTWEQFAVLRSRRD